MSGKTGQTGKIGSSLISHRLCWFAESYQVGAAPDDEERDEECDEVDGHDEHPVKSYGY